MPITPNTKGANQKGVSSHALSLALVICSVAGLAGATVAFLTNRQSKDGWSAAPVSAMLLGCLSPLLCLTIGFLLVRLRRRNSEKFTALDWCGLVGAAGAIVTDVFWVAGVLKSLRDMGVFPPR